MIEKFKQAPEKVLACFQDYKKRKGDLMTKAGVALKRIKQGETLYNIYKELPYRYLSFAEGQRVSSANGNPCIIVFQDGSQLDIEKLEKVSKIDVQEFIKEGDLF